MNLKMNVWWLFVIYVYVISDYTIYNCWTFYLHIARCEEYSDLFTSYKTSYKNETLFVANL